MIFRRARALDPCERHAAVASTSPGDAELISAVRGGDVDAYGELFSRHVEAARRLARQLVAARDADDLVSEAFAKVLVVLQRGGGPDLAFRAYLLTAVRRLHVDRIRAGARLQHHRRPDAVRPRRAVPRHRGRGLRERGGGRAPSPRCPSAGRWCCGTPRSRARSPPTSRLLLGMSANSVSALAYRAREGLRQAFLSMHAAGRRRRRLRVDPRAPRRLRPRRRSRAATRPGSRPPRRSAAACAAVYLELTEVNSNLAGLLAPLLLGGAAAAYVASAGAAAAACRWARAPARPGAGPGARARPGHRRAWASARGAARRGAVCLLGRSGRPEPAPPPAARARRRARPSAATRRPRSRRAADPRGPHRPARPSAGRRRPHGPPGPCAADADAGPRRRPTRPTRTPLPDPRPRPRPTRTRAAAARARHRRRHPGRSRRRRGSPRAGAGRAVDAGPAARREPRDAIARRSTSARPTERPRRARGHRSDGRTSGPRGAPTATAAVHGRARTVAAVDADRPDTDQRGRSAPEPRAGRIV